MRQVSFILGAAILFAACGGGGGGGGGSGPGDDLVDLRFDFQDAAGNVAAGHEAVTPREAWSAGSGFGFVTPPRATFDGTRHAFTIFGRTIPVDRAVPSSVLSAATIDGVVAAAPYTFRAEVPPGEYDVTLWLGQVTTPRHRVRATVNGTAADATRMDVNHLRGSFDQAVFGNVVPRTVRVPAPDGLVEIELGPHPDGASPVEWTYLQDEDPKNPPRERTVVLVPAYSAAALAAVAIRTAKDPPLVMREGVLEIASAPDDPALAAAVDLFNTGDMAGARAAFEALTGNGLRAAKAAGLFFVAGHPALLDEEPSLLAAAADLLAEVVADDPSDLAAQDLLGQVRRMADAERYRRLYGYASSGASAAENMGRSSALVEELPADHPYHRKGRILWLRNRGGLDPRRVTASWERAQLEARELLPAWGDVNPYVRLYATDEWEPDGERWTVVDWAAAAGEGPEWARSLVTNLNAWLDLFEWWSIHRQAPEGDLGGGWTDDVEIVPAFGLMAYVLDGASAISEDAVLLFADGIWESDIVNEERGYQRQYADVEHTAEPTGNILHLHPLVRFGDPEGIERMLVSAKTFSEFFLTAGTTGDPDHRHFRGNHLSATAIATNPDHRADIPLCGRVVAPFSFLTWYSGNPDVEDALGDWIGAWADDAARTDAGKPAGVFPNAVRVPDDSIGIDGDWWSRDPAHGQYSEFPGYQFYLYSIAGFYWLRTGEERFRAPFDALRDLTLAWDRAGRPDTGDAPRAGAEELFCGEKLGSIGAGAALNAKLGSGLDDWDAYLAQFGGSYARFVLSPTDPAPLADLDEFAEALYDRWPYRTTEGLMTDRILVPGWAEVISYYLGAEVFSVFFGMPAHAVTWRDTTRLFAAAVTEASDARFAASLYRFADTPREVGVRFWQLTPGASYVLERGPADDLGLAPSSLAESVPFRYDELGQEVRFTLPGRTVTALRVRKTADPDPAPPALRPDLGIAPRDVSWDPSTRRVTVRVHNLGAANAPPTTLRVRAGGDSWTAAVPAVPAPAGLVPSRTEVVVDLGPGPAPERVTVEIDAVADEITTANNVAEARLSDGAPGSPAPMITAIRPGRATAGTLVTLEGRNFNPGLAVLASEEATAAFAVETVLPDRVVVRVLSPAAGIHLLSLANPDGKRSNPVPLEIE